MTERKSSAASCNDALLNNDAFLPHLQTFLAAHAEGQWCVAAIDEESFKRYQEWCEQQKDHKDTPLPKELAPVLDQLKQRQQQLDELERALGQEEFCFYVQPKCNSMTRAIVGMEALVRWNHPTRGVVAPGEFVPLMEETGLITKLDLYLWESVCKMLHRWKEEKRNLVPISVNVSIADITSLDVARTFGTLVERYQLEPKLLLVEITESMMAQNMELVENTIKALHRKGFSVLMDDFGSGYSSLNMLKDTSVDGIKLDLKFIDMDRSNEGKGRQIVESVVEMAHRLHLPIIAEGVENQEQVHLLQAMDCLYVQGYYFYRPMPIADAEELMAQPTNEDYWDLKRDLLRRDHKAFTGGLVSEKSAIALQAFQIIADNVLELGRLDLLTGEYRAVRREAALPGGPADTTEDFATHCRELAETFFCKEEVEPFCAQFGLERLRAELFARPRPVFCYCHKREPSPCPRVAVVAIPAKGCSEKDPWAVVMMRETN